MNDEQRSLLAVLVSCGHIHRDLPLGVHLLLVRFQRRVLTVEDLAVRQLHHELELPPLRIAFVRQIWIDLILRPHLKSPIALIAGTLGVGFGGME